QRGVARKAHIRVPGHNEPADRVEATPPQTPGPGTENQKPYKFTTDLGWSRKKRRSNLKIRSFRTLTCISAAENVMNEAPGRGEFAFIDWVRSRTPLDRRVLVGPGDDTAVLSWDSANPCLLTTDMLLEGSCFLLESGAHRVGRKALAVNLS